MPRVNIKKLPNFEPKYPGCQLDIQKFSDTFFEIRAKNYPNTEKIGPDPSTISINSPDLAHLKSQVSSQALTKILK